MPLSSSSVVSLIIYSSSHNVKLKTSWEQAESEIQELSARPLFFPFSVQFERGTSSSMAKSTNSPLKSDALFEQLKQYLATDAGKQIIKKVGHVYQINISPKKIGTDEVVYTIDLKKGEVTKGPYGGKPDATLSFKDEDFVKVALGKMNPQIAFMRGALKIKGSITAAQKFTPDIFPKPAKL